MCFDAPVERETQRSESDTVDANHFDIATHDRLRDELFAHALQALPVEIEVAPVGLSHYLVIRFLNGRQGFSMGLVLKMSGYPSAFGS